MILHIPHASHRIPAEVRDQFVLNDEALQAELLRMTDAFTDELFEIDEVEKHLIRMDIAPDRSVLRAKWRGQINEVLTAATLNTPAGDCYMAKGSWQGQHSEHLGYLLAELQIVARSFPEARW